MPVRLIFVVPGLLFLLAPQVRPQTASGPNASFPVHLNVAAGTPLRLYITHRVSYRLGEAIEAKSIQPIWAFDRIVIPTGSTVQGRIVKLEPVPKLLRARAIVGGD